MTEYMIFVLGYDLLHQEFDECEHSECDIVYEKCKHIYQRFKDSHEYYNDLRKPEYDALNDWIKENYESIIELIQS